MSPTNELLGPTGNQWIVVHAGTKQPQAPFATQCVVAGQKDHAVRANQLIDQHSSKVLPKVIDAPPGLAEEAMVVGEMAVCHGIAGDNQIGDIAVPKRQNPTCHQQLEGGETRCSENGSKYL